MDLRSLRYFLAVARERHIGRAASRLHMTQPPLSRAIRELEDELGVILFERTPKGVTLTPAGAVMYDEAAAVLERADRLRNRVATAAGVATLTIGTLADTAAHVGGKVVSLFRAHHPHVNVGIHEADLGDPTAGLRTGLVEVTLTRTPSTTLGSTCACCARFPSVW
ncbi:LysR family transcriptional regulator [Nocardia sp. ET3-3]|uniref:LysR family transcriptional regulator n=1 Tax=Nocardia terrae TaxID=2675851 RepID=A0A7K1V5K4_9NOCA|nr:LysR family transcriptional regulator [Nocardia terrae]